MPDVSLTAPVATQEPLETTPLERSYRRWLRLLPKDYRRQWQDDMVDTFLAGALRGTDEERELSAYGKPSLAEIASVASLGLRLRLGATEAPPRPAGWQTAWRAAWRNVALIGLLLNAIWVTVSVPATLLLDGWMPEGVAPDGTVVDEALLTEGPTTKMLMFGWWSEHDGWRGLAMVIAFLALLYGFRRTAALFAVAGMAPWLIGAVRYWVDDGLIYNVAQAAPIIVQLLPVIALISYVGGAPARRRAVWIVAWLASAAVLGVASIIAWTMSLRVLVDYVGIYSVLLAVGGAVYLYWLRRRHQTPALDWSLTVVILSVVILLSHLAFLPVLWLRREQFDPVDLSSISRWIYVELGLLAVVAAIFGAIVVRLLRQLPAVDTADRT